MDYQLEILCVLFLIIFTEVQREETDINENWFEGMFRHEKMS